MHRWTPATPAIGLASAAAVVVAAFVPLAAAAQALVRIGSQRYVLTQVNADAYPDVTKSAHAIHAEGGVCAYAFVAYDSPVTRVRVFDGYTPRGPSFAAMPPAARYADVNAVLRDGPLTWVVRDTIGTDARVFDDTYAPLDDVVHPFMDDYYSFFNYSIDARDGRVAILVAGRRTPHPSTSVVMRVYTNEGVPLSDPITASEANSAEVRIWEGCVSARTDRTWVIAYNHQIFPRGSVYLQRVFADYSVGPPISLSTDDAFQPYVKALDDGTLLVTYYKHDSPAESRMLMFDAEGHALTAVVSIGGRYDGICARRDGSFVVARADAGTDPSIQVFRPGGLPAGPPVDVVLDETYGLHDFFEVDQPIAFEEDGTIWILWVAAYGDGPDGPSPSYLSQLKPFDPGDMNYDRVVDNGDIDAFVLALTAPEVYETIYPGVPYRFIGDMNEDGAFDNGDIDGFVAALLG